MLAAGVDVVWLLIVITPFAGGIVLLTITFYMIWILRGICNGQACSFFLQFQQKSVNNKNVFFTKIKVISLKLDIICMYDLTNTVRASLFTVILTNM